MDKFIDESGLFKTTRLNPFVGVIRKNRDLFRLCSENSRKEGFLNLLKNMRSEMLSGKIKKDIGQYMKSQKKRAKKAYKYLMNKKTLLKIKISKDYSQSIILKNNEEMHLIKTFNQRRKVLIVGSK